ncbi:MAG: putative sporulation protein YtxC [Negativicutes bacterium]|nr:putative sporulation protein YtxC [Negativicutes bacterium]
MKILSLGLSGTSDEIKNKLEEDCPALAKEGFHVVIDQTCRGNYTFIGWNVTEGELSFRNYERVKNILKSYVVQVLADAIVTREEKVLLRKIVNHNCRFFGEEERSMIYEHAVKLLEGNTGLFSDFNAFSRYNSVLGKLKEYFDNHHELVLDGFLAFRLKDYRDKLAEIVDKAVDEYMMDLEYKEFIRVLRYFVDVQEAQVEEVHVIVGGGEGFKIRDCRGKIISNQYLESFMLRNTEEINFEDLLISALITIAPRNVMLHCPSGSKSDDLMTTIQGVFEGRVIKCSGCELCQEDILGQFTP